jgi:S1-C subfamily serine protease
MSANEAADSGSVQSWPDPNLNLDQPEPVEPGLEWPPEEPGQASSPPAVDTAWAGPPSPWAAPPSPTGPNPLWATPPAPPSGPQLYHEAFTPPPPLPHAYPPYQEWAAFPAPSAASKQDGVGRRLAPLILGVALLSASLSAVGTFAAISLTTRSSVGANTAAGQANAAQQVTLTQSDAIVRVANLVKPSVVTITSQATAGLSPFSVPSTGVGSGFIVSADGLILTNNHVVAGTTSLTVVLDDTRSLTATVVSTDPAHDLALIRVNASGLTAVTLGDSSSVQVGQLAVAIGSPLGTFTDSVTQGIVSGLNRTITVSDQATRSEENLSGLIQTDAAINPGNSGGPLLDADGSAVGIITASSSNAQDMGFAIPINQAKAMIAAATK